MFPTRGVEAIVEALTVTPDGFERCVATDADGTLWSTDVGDELFVDLGERSDFRGLAGSRLRARAEAILGSLPGDDLSLAHALMARYRAGEIAIGPMCELQAEAVGDRSEQDLSALYHRVAERVAATVRPEVRALLETLASMGYSVHVVSGSLGDAVERCLTRAGIPFTTVAGARLSRRDGHVLPSLAGEIPLFDAKVRALESARAWPASLGLGDGGWDVTFLRDVHLPVLVHPKPALEEAMRGHPRAVVIG